MKSTNYLWVVCGSDLYTGQVLYLSNYDEKQLSWTADVRAAVSSESKADATQLLDVVKRIDRIQHTVDPYIIQTDQTLTPIKKRERMRIQGPSIKYQQVGDHVSV